MRERRRKCERLLWFSYLLSHRPVQVTSLARSSLFYAHVLELTRDQPGTPRQAFFGLCFQTASTSGPASIGAFCLVPRVAPSPILPNPNLLSGSSCERQTTPSKTCARIHRGSRIQTTICLSVWDVGIIQRYAAVIVLRSTLGPLSHPVPKGHPPAPCRGDHLSCDSSLIKQGSCPASIHQREDHAWLESDRPANSSLSFPPRASTERVPAVPQPRANLEVAIPTDSQPGSAACYTTPFLHVETLPVTC